MVENFGMLPSLPKLNTDRFNTANQSSNIALNDFISICPRNPPLVRENLKPTNIKLGEATSGTVSLYIDSSTNLQYAVKCVPNKDDEDKPKKVEETIAETRSHENIVKCYALYHFDGNTFFVLEYMDKGCLETILKQSKGHVIPKVYLPFVAYQIAEGLADLNDIHQERIIHRDLKPGNILVNKKGEVKISDFGVSTIISNSKILATSSSSSFSRGTKLYQSPERINQLNYGVTSDIWSVGVILLECMLGEHPFPELADPSNKITPEFIESFMEEKKISTLCSADFFEFVKKCLIYDMVIRPKARDLMRTDFILNLERGIPFTLKQQKDNFTDWLKNEIKFPLKQNFINY